MTIPKSYEALAADLASEKIISKTLLGQKEAYMMLADKGRLDLATWKQKACEAAEREAALREELEQARATGKSYMEMSEELQQRLTVAERRESEAREELLDLSRKLDVFYSRSHGIKNLSAIEDANDKSKALQQRLAVAEQRAFDLEKEKARLDYIQKNWVSVRCNVKNTGFCGPTGKEFEAYIYSAGAGDKSPGEGATIRKAIDNMAEVNGSPLVEAIPAESDVFESHAEKLFYAIFPKHKWWKTDEDLKDRIRNAAIGWRKP